ncbi:hypothetical protein ATANTOWER_010568, partial [Ataeniobius toweri]|nr:hypothetical protein [Ataeniobius toweri]
LQPLEILTELVIALCDADISDFGTHDLVSCSAVPICDVHEHPPTMLCQVIVS